MTPEQATERAGKATPQAVVELCERLHAAGHGAWVVGGCLRDVLLGKTPADWDVASTAEPPQVMNIFKRVIPTGIQHGTVMVRHRGHSYEVTTLRGETTYSDARRPDQVFFVQDIAQDLARRDFTVNAMAYDPLAHRLVDVFDGLEDLRACRLRTVGPAIERFREDGLRVLRAARFVASLEFALDPDTEAAIAPSLPSFRRVSHERVREEWIKALRARCPSRAFDVMARTGILADIYPAVAAWTQGADGETRWQETLRGVDATPRDTILRMAALFRSFVAETAVAGEGTPTADCEGRELVHIDAWLQDYRFSNAERSQITHLLRHFSSVLQLRVEPAPLRHWLHDVGREHAEGLLTLARAHVEAQEPVKQASLSHLDQLAGELEALRTSRVPLTTRELAVSGRELMTHLGCPPGPEVGRLLEWLLHRVLDEPSLNQRDTLLELAATRARERS